MEHLRCPDAPVTKNLIELNELFNGFQGKELAKFAHDYQKLRASTLEESDGREHIFETIKNFVKNQPYTTKKRDKKKTRIQTIFEENHYPQQRPMHGNDHPISVRDTKQVWNMNPGRLYIPKHVGDRMREVQFGQKSAGGQ